MDESRLEDLEKRIDELEGKLTKIYQVLTRISDEYGVMYSHVESIKLDMATEVDRVEEELNKLKNSLITVIDNPIIRFITNNK